LLKKHKIVGGKVSFGAESLKRFGSPKPGNKVTVWLLEIDPGHYGAYTEADIKLRLGIVALTADPLSLKTRRARERFMALRARLIDTEITSVRFLKIPPEIFQMSEEHLDDEHVWLDQTEGFLGICTASYYEKIRSLRLENDEGDASDNGMS
jgi:hypothetical protein